LLPPLILLLLSGAIRLYHLGNSSLWFDEAVLYWIAQGTPGDVIRQNAALNSAPPLYPLLVHGVSYIGSSEAILRSVSWAAGVLGILSFYNLARRSVSNKAAFLTSILLCVALFHVEYSQELREYSLGFLLSILLTYCYSRFIDQPGIKETLAMLATFIVSIFTQYGLEIVLIAINLHFILELIRSNNRKQLLSRWASVQVLSLFATLIVYLIALRFQFTSTGFLHVEQGYWRGGLSGFLPFLYRQTYDILLYFFLDPPAFLIGALIGAFYLLADRSRWFELAKISLPFIVAMSFAGLEIYPYAGARQTIYLAPFLFLFLAYGIDYMLKVDVKGIIALSFMVLTLRTYLMQTNRFLQHPGPQNLRSLIETLEDEQELGDKVYVCPGAIPAFRYYYQGSEEVLVGPVEGDRWKVDLGATVHEDWQESLEVAILGDSRLWVVWVGQCGDKQMYIEFIRARAAYDQLAVRDQAALLIVY